MGTHPESGSRSRKALASVAAGCLSLAGIVAGVTGRGLAAKIAPRAPVRAAQHVPAASLNIIFSTDLDGFLAPCGCTSPQIGGLPRRATYLRGFPPTSPPIEVENGDLTLAEGRQDELKADTIVDILGALGYQAINLGEKDFRLGLPYLRSLQHRFPGKMLCANAHAQGQAIPLFPTHVVVQAKAGKLTAPVVITGLISDSFQDQVSATDPTIVLDPPAAVLRRIGPAMRAAGKIQVLLYHGPIDEAAALAQQFPFFNLIVCAHGGDEPVPPVRVGQTLLACNGTRGKYIGRAILTAGTPWRATATYKALGPDLPDNPLVASLKQVYLDRVDMEHLLARVLRAPTDNGDNYAGSQACAACHQQAYATWQKSEHARALSALVKVGEDRDPECVICHTVGLDRESGYASPGQTPQLANVGCEACHGPAARHVVNPASEKLPATTDVCITCHDSDQSPHFRVNTYWPRIQH